MTMMNIMGIMEGMEEVREVLHKSNTRPWVGHCQMRQLLGVQ
jgi:hypothetical protein